MKKFRILLAMLMAATFCVSCDKDDDNDYDVPPPPPPPQVKATVVSAAGDLTASIAQFRSILGDSLNVNPGKTSGRREVNWDGVPANIANTNNFPADFFNVTDPLANGGRKRGLVYTSAGASFRVDTSSFSQIEATYLNEFKPFSGNKLFATATSNITEIAFKVPGTNTDAFTKGFGLIFSDVDDANSTTLEFFNGTKSLGVYKAPVRKDANGFSFLGVFFPDEKVTKVKITAGNAALAAGVKDISAGGAKDIVVMDDFFYAEPLPLN